MFILSFTTFGCIAGEAAFRRAVYTLIAASIDCTENNRVLLDELRSATLDGRGLKAIQNMRLLGV